MGETPAGLATIDLLVVAAYAIGIFALAQWVSREKPGQPRDSTDYILASKALPWCAIGASLIAANISAEQIVGMSGSGYAIGLAIASYEWMAAVILAGFHRLTELRPGHFDMILSKDHPFYRDLPGLSVVIGGMWIANLTVPPPSSCFRPRHPPQPS